MSLQKEEKSKIINDFAINEKDTGSVEVQVAVLTTRILQLTGHLKKNDKDYSARRGLLILVARRKKLLSYLKRKSETRYLKLIESLGLKR